MTEQKISKQMDKFLDEVDFICFKYGFEILPHGDLIEITGEKNSCFVLFIDGDGRGK